MRDECAFWFSFDEDSRWRGPFDTREEAATEGLSSDWGEHSACFTAKGVRPVVDASGLAWPAVELVYDRLIDGIGGFGENGPWCNWPEADPEIIKSLDLALKAAFDKWVADNGLSPTWFIMEEIEKHEPSSQ